jgi:hypothetical protein
MIKNDCLQELGNFQGLLYRASLFNNELMKKQAIDQINRTFPDIADEVIRMWSILYPNEKFIIHDSVYKLSSKGTDDNVELYLWVINNRVNQYYNWSISSTAVYKIFFQPQPLSQEYVLYTKNEKELKVSEFLSVLSYGKKFAEAFFGVDSPKANEYVLAAKTVDLAINHKEVDKPLNKTLHILNDVLTEYGKDLREDKGEKMVLSGISLLVDLVIDFLVKA